MLCSFTFKVYNIISSYNNMTDINTVNNIIDNEILHIIKDGIKNINKINYIYDRINDNHKDKNIDRNIIKKRVKDVNNYRAVLKELVKEPIIKQRTKEWFDARENRLTASDLYDAIKDSKISDSIAKKKAKITKDNINYNAIKALKWGTMFEPMASRIYSEINKNINIYEFGLICDKNNEHFGASPDGINELGIMIEIKCPYSRKIIDTYIPEKYLMQIQGQLAVCNLNECDYIECKFLIIEESEYIEEFENSDSDDIKHGIIAEYISKKGEYTYLYSDNNKKAADNINDIYNKMRAFDEDSKDSENNIYEYVKLNYWKLDKINTQRVIFNKNEWGNISDKINIFWEKVERFKLNPIEKIKFINEDDDN